MDSSVATASKDVAKIRARRYAHYGLRGLQRSIGDRPAEWDTLALYPAFDDVARLGDVLNRLAWYFPAGVLEEEFEILVPADNETLAGARTTVPDEQAAYDTDHLPIGRVNPADAGGAADLAGRVAIWNRRALLSRAVVRNLRGVEVVDPNYYDAHEPNTMERLSDRVTTGDETPSRETFRRLAAQTADATEAYVFATGPSLSEAKEMTIPDDAITVICNSIVRDEELLEQVNPDVLTFADPVFHFGPSRYAARFREDAVDAMRRYDCVGAIPAVYADLFGAHFPDVTVMGMPRRRNGQPRFPDEMDLSVWATGNIMTVGMLPIASALAETVNVVGADGRAEDESYFWEHNDDAQYDDELMQTVADCHPAFFRDRVYTDYYREHVENLERIIEYGESRGVTYRTLTDSYVECLQERRAEAPRREEESDAGSVPESED